MIGECWLYAGHITEYGYGRFYSVINGKRKDILAHVAMYEALVEEIPEGMELDHLCRVRSCINPKHLEPVTHLENVRRGEAGKRERARTHCPRGHIYSETNTYLYSKKLYRHCRKCARRRWNEWKLREQEKKNDNNRVLG